MQMNRKRKAPLALRPALIPSACTSMHNCTDRRCRHCPPHGSLHGTLITRLTLRSLASRCRSFRFHSVPRLEAPAAFGSEFLQVFGLILGAMDMESARKWIVEHKLRAVGTLWATSLLGSFAYNFAQPAMKMSVKLIHARLHAQALTLAALAGSALVEAYDHQSEDKAKRYEKQFQT